MRRELFTISTRGAEETERFGAEFAGGLAPGDFVALFGDLGMGKTAFVRGMARALAPDAEVTSPTFTLMNLYPGSPPLYHFDMYRIATFDELYGIGFFDYLDGDGVVAVEWSENIPFGLPERRYEVRFARTQDADGREITVTEVGS